MKRRRRARPGMHRFGAVLALLAASPGAAGFAPGRGDAPAGVAAWVADLASDDALRQEAARRHLFVRGRDATAALADGLAEAGARAFIARLDLLAAMAPEDSRRFLPAAADHSHPGVRAAAAAALARVEPWDEAIARALLQDGDPHVAAALLGGLEARTLPVRRRFAAAFGGALESAVARGDPGTRRRALALLLLDDAPAAAERVERLLPALERGERSRLLAGLVARPPAWEGSRLAALARSEDAALADPDPERRLLARRLQARFDPDAAARIDDEALLELLRFAGRPVSAAQEHAAGALAALFPGVAPRLRPLLRELCGEEGLPGVLEVFLRLRGVAGVEELVEELVRPGLPQAAALAMIAALARLPCEAVARRLDERVAPRIAAALRPALAEAALRMPPSEPRNRLLLNALKDLAGDARLRPFEALARTGDGALLGFLLDALDAEGDARVRGRMIEQVAESFGASEPDDVLALLHEQFESARESDRLAALEGVPFVALGSRADRLAVEIVRRFSASAPEPLLHVLAQIGGDIAESTFRRLGDRLARDPAADETYRFLVARSARLRGEPTRELLLAALEDPRARLRETALRALIERGEPAAVERAPALLAGLDAAVRAALLADLGGLRHRPGYAALVRRLFAEAAEEASRLALLELADASLREEMVPATLALLAETRDPDERNAALEALGRLGGEAALACLRARVDDALALEERRFHEGDAAFAEGRTALLALAGASGAAMAPRLATMLLRIEAARGGDRVARAAFGLPARAALADPALLDALAARPAAEAVAALDAAWRALGPAADLCEERFFSACAQAAAQAGAPEETCEWFDRRVVELWPPDSAADFRALLPPGPRREMLRRGALGEIDDELLASVPSLVAALARGAPPARETMEALGRRDALLGASPERTLAVLAAVAEAAAPGRPLDRSALPAAFREADECAPLLRGVAALAARAGLALDPELRARVEAAAPADSQLAALRRALESERR